MRIALISRTVIMLVWLAGLLWQAERNATTALIAVSLVAVWAAPLLRDALRGRPAAVAPRAEPRRAPAV
jgi:hypothetical protein